MQSPDLPPTDDFYCDYVLSHRIEVSVVAENDMALAYHHTRPFWPVHIVVIPKQHVASLVDPATDDVLPRVMSLVREVAQQVLDENGACQVLTNLGGYQDSKHLHFHVAFGPRRDDR